MSLQQVTWTMTAKPLTQRDGIHHDISIQRGTSQWNLNIVVTSHAITEMKAKDVRIKIPQLFSLLLTPKETRSAYQGCQEAVSPHPQDNTRVIRIIYQQGYQYVKVVTVYDGTLQQYQSGYRGPNSAPILP